MYLNIPAPGFASGIDTDTVILSFYLEDVLCIFSDASWLGDLKAFGRWARRHGQNHRMCAWAALWHRTWGIQRCHGPRAVEEIWLQDTLGNASTWIWWDGDGLTMLNTYYIYIHIINYNHIYIYINIIEHLLIGINRYIRCNINRWVNTLFI